MTQEKFTITTRNKLLKIFLIFVLAVTVTFCGRSYALADDGGAFPSAICTGTPSELETKLRNNLENKFLTYEGCPTEMGAWYMLPMPKEEDRMQAVHAVVLPNSKVLIVNGSSNRNHVIADNTIEDGLDNSSYEVVNNTSIFDPSLSDFYYNPQPNFEKTPYLLQPAKPAIPVVSAKSCFTE